MPNGTYGGVRGRKTKVGRKLSFSSYSINILSIHFIASYEPWRRTKCGLCPMSDLVRGWRSRLLPAATELAAVLMDWYPFARSRRLEGCSPGRSLKTALHLLFLPSLSLTFPSTAGTGGVGEGKRWLYADGIWCCPFLLAVAFHWGAVGRDGNWPCRSSSYIFGNLCKW